MLADFRLLGGFYPAENAGIHGARAGGMTIRRINDVPHLYSWDDTGAVVEYPVPHDDQIGAPPFQSATASRVFTDIFQNEL